MPKRVKPLQLHLSGCVASVRSEVSPKPTQRMGKYRGAVTRAVRALAHYQVVVVPFGRERRCHRPISLRPVEALELPAERVGDTVLQEHAKWLARALANDVGIGA